jgi:hypothetical protein
VEERKQELQKTEPGDNELYEELLNRYERVLVYAGQLQEKVRHQKLLAEKNDSLERELEKLRRLVSLEQSYNRLLENALKSLGVLKGGKNPKG